MIVSLKEEKKIINEIELEWPCEYIYSTSPPPNLRSVFSLVNVGPIFHLCFSFKELQNEMNNTTLALSHAPHNHSVESERARFLLSPLYTGIECTSHTFIFGNLSIVQLDFFFLFVSLLLLLHFLIFFANAVQWTWHLIAIFFPKSNWISYHQNWIKLPKAIYPESLFFMYSISIPFRNCFVEVFPIWAKCKSNGMRHWNEICFASTNGKCTWMLSA